MISNELFGHIFFNVSIGVLDVIGGGRGGGDRVLDLVFFLDPATGPIFAALACILVQSPGFSLVTRSVAYVDFFVVIIHSILYTLLVLSVIFHLVLYL